MKVTFLSSWELCLKVGAGVFKFVESSCFEGGVLSRHTGLRNCLLCTFWRQFGNKTVYDLPLLH